MATHEPPATRLTLIGDLCRGLRWEEFVALYGWLILAWGRRDFGLQASDAENLCQEVLLRVWKGIPRYDPARGRFRAWLYVCTRNAFASLHRQGKAWVGGRNPCIGPDLPVAVADGRERLSLAGQLDEAVRALEEEGFDGEGLQEAVRRVRAAVRPATWKAFLLFEFFELSAREIAPQLGMTPAAVSQGIYRVRLLLRQALGERLPGRTGNSGA
jgi:RNA polymerase sigma factor (sigma-70 family)